MNFEQLNTFLSITSTRSYSKTAKLLFVSQPAVSARIRSLEEKIGYPLFKQVDNQIQLTKEGEVFYPFAKGIIRDVTDGLEAIDRVHNKVEGNLSVAVVLTLTHYYLPNIIASFHQSYPNITLNIQTGHSNNVLGMVLNHEVSFGITREISHPNIKAFKLLDDEMILVTYPSHPLASKHQINLKQLATEPMILFNRGSVDWNLINDAFNRININPNIIMKTDNLKIIQKMIQSKLGISIMPRSAVQDKIASGEVCAVEISDPINFSRPFQLIQLKNEPLNNIAKLFEEFLIKKLINLVSDV